MLPPKLENYEEFKKILDDYHVSDHAKSLLDKIKFVLLISPTSAGRNTIIKKLLETNEYEYIISDTTRPKRENNGVMEQDGVEYWFRSEKDVLEDLRNGEFLEAAIIHQQQVSGISMRELEKASKHDKIAINELEISGANRVSKAKQDAYIIFVLPPTFTKWMDRLSKRGQMHQDEYLNRLKSAEKELQAAIDHDYYKFVINDELDDAVADVRRIVEEDNYTEEEHQKGTDLSWELLNQVKRELYS